MSHLFDVLRNEGCLKYDAEYDLLHSADFLSTPSHEYVIAFVFDPV